MDTRLYKIAGRRLARLRKQDLPEAALALLETIRKRATISGLRRNNVSFVWIRGRRANLTILKEDWEKIEPFFKDGSFVPLVTPILGDRGGWLRREVAYDGPPLDGADKGLYETILQQLQQLFPEEWPTSLL